MTISFAELEHSTFEMSRYISQECVRENTETSNPENSRFHTLPAKSPRTPIVATFFSEILKMASRTISAVKAKWESSKQRATVLWSYRTACNDSIKSLKLTLESEDILEVSKQLKNFCESRERQIKFLNVEDPASATKFEKNYHRIVK